MTVVHRCDRLLATLDELGRPKELAGGHSLDAVRGELLRRAGRPAEALEATEPLGPS